MTRAEWTRLGGFSGGVVLLHVLGFGLFLYYSPHYPALAGLAACSGRRRRSRAARTG